MIRARSRTLVTLMLAAVVVTAAWRAVPAEVETVPPAGALSITRDVERQLLEEDIVAHRHLAARRTDVVSRLTQLYRSLDSLIHGEQPAAGRLDGVIEQIERIEGDRAALLTAEHVLIGRISDRQRRIALLETRLAEIEGRQVERQADLLDGTWELVLMPYEQRGEAELDQTGTLVTGTYRLEGGADGSLQGTLVNRRLRLIRIDSKLGRSMELEGQLSPDGTTIRGSWLNLELAGSEGGTGHWSARRRVRAADETP